MTAKITPGAQLPAPIATDAGIASRPVGPCAICSRAVLRGARYALAYPDEQIVHVVCVARQALATATGETS